MKRTSLYDTHVAAGATLVPFAGWEMPVSYPTGTVAEVAAVRQRVGVFDVSHMGRVSVTGDEAPAFLQRVTANDVSRLTPGKAQYSLLLNETGGVIDDIIVYCDDPTDYLLILNAGCHDKDYGWLETQTQSFPYVSLSDESAETALIAVQGPEAVALVSSLPFAPDFAPLHPLSTLRRFEFTRTMIGQDPVMLSRTGYTGEDGFELLCERDFTPTLWRMLVTAGATPAGLGARDVLRLEAAYPLYGHELDAEHRPQESGVGWAVKPAKGDFVGREALSAPATQQLVGLRMDQRAIPREGYPVLNAEATGVIGQVTSGTWSPTVQAGIALARLDANFATPGTRVTVDIRGRQAGAAVVPLPFYRNGV